MSLSSSSELNTTSHLLFVLPSHSYPAFTDKGQEADLVTELAFFSYSHMLTILPFSSPAGLPPAPAPPLGRQPLCVRHSPYQGHCPWPHHGCRWVSTVAFTAWEALVSWVGTGSHEPGAMLCLLEVVSSPLRRCNSPGNPTGECDIGGGKG